MRTLIYFVLLEGSVFIGRQQLAPKFTVSSFGGGHVIRKARRIAEAFKGAVKDAVHGESSNSWHIQITTFVFHKNMLSNSLQRRGGGTLKQNV